MPTFVVTLSAVILPLLYALIQLALNWEFLQSFCDPKTDYVLISLAVEAAKQGEAFTGAYSRFGFRHPGPGFFYLYALGDSLFGFLPVREGRFALTQLLVSGVFIAAIVAMVAKFVRHAWISAALFPLLMILFAGSTGSPLPVLSNVWNPYTTVASFAAFIFLAAAVADGNWKYFPFFIIAGTLAGHSHLGVTPPLILLGLLTCYRAYRNRAGSGFRLRYAAAGVAALCIGLLPIVYEATLRPGGGNLGAIFRFSVAPSSGQTVADVYALLARYIVKPLSFGPSAAAPFVAGVLLASLALPLQAPRFVRELRLIVIVGFLTSFASLLRTKGELIPYLAMYVFGLVGALYLIVLVRLENACVPVSARLTARTTPFRSLLGPRVILPLLFWMAAIPTIRSLPANARCSLFSEAKVFARALSPQPGALYRIRLANPRLIHSGSTFALRMRRQGRRVCVDDTEGFRFGPSFTCSYQCGMLRRKNLGVDGATLYFSTAHDPPPPSTQPVAASGAVRLSIDPSLPPCV